MVVITYGSDAYPMIDGTSISVREPGSRWKIPQGSQIRVPFKCTFILIKIHLLLVYKTSEKLTAPRC